MNKLNNYTINSALVEIKQNKKLGEIATNISKSTEGLFKEEYFGLHF